MPPKRIPTPEPLHEWLRAKGRELALVWTHEERDEDRNRWVVASEYVHVPTGRGVVVRVQTTYEGGVLSTSLFVEAAPGNQSWVATLEQIDSALAHANTRSSVDRDIARGHMSRLMTWLEGYAAALAAGGAP
jgi:hypothetical protein